MPDISDDQIIYEGSICTIAYAKTRSGDMPAYKFLNELSLKRDKNSKIAIAGLKNMFELMGEQGRIANREQFKKVMNKIFAFKKYQVRIPAFQEGNVWFLTHGFKKKRDKWPLKEIKRAERIRVEHLEHSKRTG